MIRLLSDSTIHLLRKHINPLGMPHNHVGADLGASLRAGPIPRCSKGTTSSNQTARTIPFARVCNTAMTTATDQPTPESCVTLLSRLPSPRPVAGRKLSLGGVPGRDVYNIAAPFELQGVRVLAGRVERRDIEHSEIVFFAEANGTWQPIPSAPTLPGLQDPCVTFIGGQLVLGGVRFPVTVADGSIGWRMEFYRGSSLGGLTLFLHGPDKMKDIRLVELTGGRVAVLTRPQGEKGGRGKIGFMVADNLDAITAAAIEAAPLFLGQCREDEWLGANEAHALPNGMIGVLGHIAYFDAREHRHYYPMVFSIDPRSGQATAPRIIGSRADFPDGPAKRPDLTDVMFSGGLVRHGDGTATLYAGLSDAEAGCVRLPDPFLAFEAASPA